MKSRIRHITKLLFAFLMIGFMGFMVANEAIFRHTHEVNGKIVTHAHPYQKSQDTDSGQTHKHSTPQILILDNAMSLFIVLFTVLIIIPIARKINRYQNHIPLINIWQRIPLQGRAPPFMA